MAELKPDKPRKVVTADSESASKGTGEHLYKQPPDLCAKRSDPHAVSIRNAVTSLPTSTSKSPCGEHFDRQLVGLCAEAERSDALAVSIVDAATLLPTSPSQPSCDRLPETSTQGAVPQETPVEELDIYTATTTSVTPRDWLCSVCGSVVDSSK